MTTSALAPPCSQSLRLGRWEVVGEVQSGQGEGCRLSSERPWRSAHFLVKKMRLKGWEGLILGGYEPFATAQPKSCLSPQPTALLSASQASLHLCQDGWPGLLMAPLLQMKSLMKCKADHFTSSLQVLQ